jgi:HEAT repeat protein
LWRAQLDSPQAELRRSAAFSLGRIGKDAVQTVPKLVELVGNDKEDAAVREAAAYALGEIGPSDYAATITTLQRTLTADPDAKVRRSAAYALGCHGPYAQPAETELRNVVLNEKENPIVRENAAWALGQLRSHVSDDSMRALMKVLEKQEDNDALVRRDAATALGEIGRGRAHDAVLAVLKAGRFDKDYRVRRSALTALVRIVNPGDRIVAAGLKEEMKKLQEDKRSDPEMIRDIAFALGNIGGEDARPAIAILRDGLSDDDVEQRKLAAAALVNVGPDAFSVFDSLIKALHDPEPDVRRNAALAISHMKGRAAAAIPELVRLLDPAQPSEVRLYASEAIAYIGREAPDKLVAVLPELSRAIREDKEWRVRQRAVWALWGVDDLEKANVLPVLEPVLHETDHDSRLVRYEAAMLLGIRLGPKAPDKAIDVLVENLKDPSVRIYGGTGADVTGGGKEASGNQTLSVRSEGDARFQPARALGNIGRKANRKDVIEALEDAASPKTKDARVREAAQNSLREVKGR